MKKQQFILVGAGLVLLVLIYFFGNTTPPAKAPAAAAKGDVVPVKKIDAADIIAAAKQKLAPGQQAYVSALENAVVRGDVKSQQLKVYRQLAAFWGDSAHFFEPYAYYTGEAAKLENSEKSLTFAARQFLTELKGTNQPAIKEWMADQARDLFSRALELNPANDSTKIALGSCSIFGGSASDPQELMKGIQQILEVARRDSTNMYAQLMLGVGGVISGQYDKAKERLETVVRHEPNNLEALLMLAEACERTNDNAGAIRWYEVSKKLIGNPDMVKELNQRIKSLK